MPVARQLPALLGFSAPLILLTCSSALRDRPSASLCVAQAQGKASPARIDFSLPPERVTPPVFRPLTAARPHPFPPRAPAALARYAPGPQHYDSLRINTTHAAAPARRPPLFTAACSGRLLYRKGYLGDVPVHLVVVDLNDPSVQLGVLVARAGIGSTESFSSMIHRAQPAAAITGTFFGVHNGLPTGDLVVNGHALYRGFVGTAIAFTEGNLVSFIRTGYKEKTAWRFFDGVMRAGPMLVQAWQIVLGPKEEGFRSLSPAARRPRTAVGITPGGKLLLLAVKERISLWRLAKLMQTLGAYHAVAMDGGSSTGLYFHGRMVAQPARVLTNALVVYAGRPHVHQPDRTADRSAPPALRASPQVSSGPALVLGIQPVEDREKRESADNRDRFLPAAALPALAGGPPAPKVGPPAAAIHTSMAESLAAGAPGSPSRGTALPSGHPMPAAAGEPVSPTGETAQSPAPGAG